MSKQNFRFAYIDAFAGTGYNEFKQDEENNLLFPSLAEDEPKRFRAGSAQIALSVEPPFQTYIFIEKDEQRFKELERLRGDPLGSDIRLIRVCLQNALPHPNTSPPVERRYHNVFSPP